MRAHQLTVLVVSFILFWWATGCTSSDSKKDSAHEKFMTKYDVEFHDEALEVEHFKNVVEHAKAQGDKDLLLWSYNKLSKGFQKKGSIDSAQQIHVKASRLLDGKRDLRFVADFYINSGNFLNYSANYDSSTVEYEKAESLLQNMEGENKRLAAIHIGLGLNSRYQNDYDSFAKHIYRALQLSEEVSDSVGIYEAKEELGILNYVEKNYKMALVIYKSSLQYHERENNLSDLSFAHTVIGLCYTQLDQFDKGLFHSQKSYDLRVSLGDERGIGESLNNLAFIQMRLKNWDKAIALLKESYTFIESAGDVRQLPIIIENISECFYYSERLDSARFYNDEALQLATKNEMKAIVSKCYNKKRKIYFKEGNYKEAFLWSQKYMVLRDSIFNSEKTNTIQKLKLEYESNKSKQDLLIARNDLRIKSYKMQRIVGTGLIVLVLVVAFFVIRAVRLKRDKIVAAKELEALSLKVDNAAKILQLKDQELKDLANQITIKNSLINEHQEGISRSNVEDRAGFHKIKLLTEEDWVNFKRKFEEIHPDLLRKIHVQGIKLSFSDKRYIMLLKLGFSTDEIARILGISISSVRTHKYRLKKKLPESLEIEDLMK